MITSTSNEHVKLVRSLQVQRKARHKAGRFVIEGTNLVLDAVGAGALVHEVYYTDEFAASPEGESSFQRLSQSGAGLQAVSPTVMRSMSDTQAPQGILAVVDIPRLPIPDDFSFALVIDAISDPGNMGSLMRVAAAAGVSLMLVTSGTVDLTNPKVVRGAMGAHFRLPVQMLSWEGVARRLAEHVIFIAEVKSGAPYYQVDWRQPSALIVSDEAHGASREAEQTAHARVTIPMPGGTESLNVAVASGILIYEMVRQRTTGVD
jgi:TrmH family RNA methyltransferase